MRTVLLCLLLLSLLNEVISQQHDNVFVFGYHRQSDPDKDGTLINFSEYPPVVLTQQQFDFNINTTGFSMSDKCGRPILFTNGLIVKDSTFQTMPNGTGLNEGTVIQNGQGHSDVMGVTCIPDPVNENHYYLIYRPIEFSDIPNVALDYPNILFAKIDMSQNSGKGIVTEKNVPVFSAISLITFSVVRHGNGRDWWIVSGETYEGKYYKTLLTENGFSSQIAQEIGFKYPASEPQDSDSDSQKLFTPNGEKYIDYDTRNGVRIMDFDRCTGELSNYQWIEFNEFIGNGAGASVSENSRFLYVTGAGRVLQYDLEAEDIADSVFTVGFYNRFFAEGNPIFSLSQLGVDGKIYINTGLSITDILHVINNPNEKGLACEFMTHSLILPNDNSAVIPRYPNYRLYDLPGSPCDTLGIDGPPEFDCEE